jgi:hypothetical protein
MQPFTATRGLLPALALALALAGCSGGGGGSATSAKTPPDTTQPPVTRYGGSERGAEPMPPLPESGPKPEAIPGTGRVTPPESNVQPRAPGAVPK